MLFFKRLLFTVFLFVMGEAFAGPLAKGLIFHCQLEESFALQLSKLKKDGNLKLALIASSSMGDVLKELRGASFEDLFDLIICEEIKKLEKEDYLRIAEMLSLSPERCISFENTKEGIFSAVKSGMRSYFVLKEDREEKLPEGCLFTLKSFSEISPKEILHMGMEIKIYKKERKLEVWEEDKIALHFPIGIGKSPFGHKETEGDFKTPEGEYFVCFKNPESKFYLSFAINYPNKKDATIGLEKKVLSLSEFEAICNAEEKKIIPPWDTPLGGEIFIHGMLEEGDGSLGCVRMFKEDIEKLYAMTPLGTKVTIFP